MKKYLILEIIFPVAALSYPAWLMYGVLNSGHSIFQIAAFLLIFCIGPAVAGFIYGRRVGGDQ